MSADLRTPEGSPRTARTDGRSANTSTKLGWRGLLGLARPLMGVLPSVATAVAGIILWQLAVKILDVSPLTLPAPTQVATYMRENFSALWTDTVVTGREILISFAISAAVGIPLGVLAHASAIFSRTVYPLLVASQAFPKLAVGPLFIVWFGFGTLPIILLAVLLIFFPITLNTILGLEAVKPETRELARMLGFGRWQYFLRIQTPQALPSVFAGLRIASTLAVVGVVVGEFLGTNSGLGYRIVNSTAVADTQSLFATLVVLAVMGALFYALIAVLERICVPWQRSKTTRGAA